jgi:Uma2 family endonuclease
MTALLKIDDHDFAPPLLTGEDVMTMTRAGILPEGRGYELIEGVLVKMASQYGPHVGMVWTISRSLARTLPDDVNVSLGGSIFLAETVMLEPDIGIYPAAMMSHDVRGPDLMLAIEVSDSTLRYDLGKKAALYAAHGVRDYWVADLNDEQIFVHTQPGADGYGARAVHPFGTALSLPFAPQIALTI